MNLFVVALRSEAAPLIERWKMRRHVDRTPFRCFTGDRAALVVTGVGAKAAARGTRHLYEIAGRPGYASWINVGVCGHPTLPVGKAVLARRVLEAASGRWSFPQILFEPPCDLVDVRTVSKVETNFETEAAFDMEAAAFFETACRLSSAELVQVVKVVSDNLTRGPERVSKDAVTRWVAGELPKIEKIVRALEPLSTQLRQSQREPEALSDISGRWSFSVTQQRRLSTVLRRLEALGVTPGESNMEGLADGRAVLAAMEGLLTRVGKGMS